MRGGTTRDAILYWLFADRIPVTKLLIISNAVTFLAIALFRGGGALYDLSFGSGWVIRKPWTAFTYPLIGHCPSPISLLFAGYWLWVAGGSLERSWGSQTFSIYFFGMSAVSALGLLLGSLLLGVPTGAVGLWLPLAGVTMALAALNPEEQILFFFLIPLKLKYLAFIDVAAVLIGYGQISPVLGVFALAGCAFSYWYVRGRRIGFCRPSGVKRRGKVIRLYERPSFLSRLNPLRWYKEYRERKRLKDLFDKSGFGE